MEIWSWVLLVVLLAGGLAIVLVQDRGGPPHA